MQSIPTIIDVEASGLGRGTYPIEVGFVTGTGDVGCTLIRPIEAWTLWSEAAERLHGISRETTYKYGKEIVAVADWLNRELAGQIVYSDGWGNDMCWLGKLFDEAERPQLFSVESLLDLLDEEERERWSQTHDHTIESANLTRHRASSDARLIQQTYCKIKGLTFDSN